MLTLYLVRHAKSSKDDPSLRDFDRPLNERGLRDAPMMARRFAEREKAVDLLVSSPALRAITTARAFAEALSYPDARILQEAAIYEADERTLLGVVQKLPADTSRVLLFGHNPGFSQVASLLSDGDPLDMPTCAVVRIDFPVDHWAGVFPGAGTYRWMDHPKSNFGIR